jgi:hypothetical protein
MYNMKKSSEINKSIMMNINVNQSNIELYMKNLAQKLVVFTNANGLMIIAS